MVHPSLPSGAARPTQRDTYTTNIEFSPIAQKTKLLLTAAGVPFERVDVPNLIPRKDLESIGIHYRRVPILAVGKSIYCDSKVIFDVVLQHLAKNKVPTSTAVSFPLRSLRAGWEHPQPKGKRDS
jgi:hypothetical protein